MQIMKAGAVAIGALATVAAMGAPAAAASHGPAGISLDKAQAMRAIGAQFTGTARGGDGWDAPWDIDPQATLSNLSGSVTNTNAFQACGSTATNAVGIATATGSPNTVLGDCDNGNSYLTQSDNFPVTGLLDDSVTSILTNQACGSTASFAVGIATALQSPNTVIGNCSNGNVRIGVEHEHHGYEENATLEVAKAVTLRKGKLATANKAPVRDGWGGDHGYDAAPHAASAPAAKLGDWGSYGHAAPAPMSALRADWGSYGHAAPAPAAQRGGGSWDAPWDVDPFGLLSTQSGSSLLTSTNQACGSTGVFDVGGAVSTGSPNTVLGECDNANVHITKLGPKAATTISDNSSVNLLPWQLCGSTGSSGVGAAASLQSPNTVFGGCRNANTVID